MTFGGLGGGYLCVPQAKGKRNRNSKSLFVPASWKYISTPFSAEVVVLFRRRQSRKSRNLLLAITHTLVTLFSTHTHTHGVKVLRTHTHHTVSRFAARTMHSEKSMCDSCCFGTRNCHAPKSQHLPRQICMYVCVFSGNLSSTLSLFLPKTADTHGVVN